METRSLVLSALFAAIVAILAQISIPLPFSPVPITGQTFGVFLAGAILGSRLGALSLLVYVLLGAAGLPVFSKFGGGLGILVGPTGGYIFSFILGAFVAGWIVERGKVDSFKRMLLAMSACLVVIYSLGTVQLAWVMDLTFTRALWLGVIPYIPLDIFKIILGSGIAFSVRRSLIKAGLLHRFSARNYEKKGVD